MALYKIFFTMCVVILSKIDARALFTEIVNSADKNDGADSKIFNMKLPTSWNDLELKTMKIVINGSLKTDGTPLNTMLRSENDKEYCYLTYDPKEGLFHIKGPNIEPMQELYKSHQSYQNLKFSLQVLLKTTENNSGQTYVIYFGVNENIEYMGSGLMKREIRHIDITEGVKSIDGSAFELLYDSDNN